MISFHETRRGAKFFDADVPRIAKALENIATQLERLNANLEAQNKPQKRLWAVNINWDTDGDSFTNLPEDVMLPEDFDKDSEVADFLSDKYGYCIKSLCVEYR